MSMSLMVEHCEQFRYLSGGKMQLQIQQKKEKIEL